MWKKLGRGWLAVWLRSLRQAQSLRLHNMHYAPQGRLSAKSVEALRILQHEPRGAIGIDIVAKSDGVLSRGSIFVVLGDLEEQGLVRAKRVRTSGRPPRPRYSITAQGLRVLVESELQGSIAEPVTR